MKNPRQQTVPVASGSPPVVKFSMKNTMIFIFFVLAVVGFLFSISGKKYPQIPTDENHRGVTEIQACLECHGPGKQFPQKPAHPPKTECFKCHKQKRAKRSQ